MIITKKLVPWAYRFFFFYETKSKKPEFIVHATRDFFEYLKQVFIQDSMKQKIKELGFDQENFLLSDHKSGKRFGGGKCGLVHKANDGDYSIFSFPIFAGSSGESVNPFIIKTLAMLFEEGNRFLYEAHKDNIAGYLSVGAQHLCVNLNYSGLQFSCDFSITMHRMLMGGTMDFPEIEKSMKDLWDYLGQSDTLKNGVIARIETGNEGQFYAKVPGRGTCSLVLHPETTYGQLADANLGYKMMSHNVDTHAQLLVLLVAIAELNFKLISEQENGRVWMRSK